MHPETRLRATAGITRRRAQQDPAIVRIGLIALAMGVIGILIVVPIFNVFYQAFSAGIATYWKNIVDPDTLHSIMMTLLVTSVAVSLNTVFGVAAAWAITRFQFAGRTILTTLIDLPFAVSPVVAGLGVILLFGMQGISLTVGDTRYTLEIGPWLRDHGIQIIFAPAGLIIVTMFVTLPFVARELIPVMEAIGSDEEVAAVSLGANGWQIFWRVTLPNIKWGLLYGVILCNARAMGEFGAVYAVSGRIAGQTDTMPLRVDKLMSEYNIPGAFAVASILTGLSLVTLFIKTILEHRARKDFEESGKMDAELEQVPE